MNKALKTMAFFALLLTMFNGIAKAQTPEPFTFTVKTLPDIGSEYECKQNFEKEGLKLLVTQYDVLGTIVGGFDDVMIDFDLNLNKSGTVGEFPIKSGEGTKIAIVLEFENGIEVYTFAHLYRNNKSINVKTDTRKFITTFAFETNVTKVDDGDNIDRETFLTLLSTENIYWIRIVMEGLLSWSWELNTFKTAPTIKSMLQMITQEQAKQSGANSNFNNDGNHVTKTSENSLSKGTWRTQMRKVLDHVTKRTTNGAYKGQIKNGWKNGYGVYWWKEGDYLFGYWSDNCKTGYCIYIYGDGYEMDNCPGCVYFVGHSVKSEKGTCYDKYGNLIYTGDFSNSRPTGTYPTEGNYSSYKFECIEYNGGGKYIGETKNGKRHGQGVYLWKNGDAWYGPWEDDSRNGYGVYLYYKGNVQYGYSKD